MILAIIKKNSLTFKFLKTYYKFFLNRRYCIQEIDSYNRAILNLNFTDHIHPIKKNIFGYTSEMGFNINESKKDLLNKILIEILQNTNDTTEANSFINYDLIEKTLSRDLTKFKKKLSDLKLPKTGSHGDLHDGNIILDLKNKIKFIDWRNYRENNTILYDIFHRDVRNLCNIKKISWTEAILSHEIDVNNFIKNSYNLSCIKLFYSLITIDLELTLNETHIIKLDKFKKLLDKMNSDY
mgnify:CR=1 FL=1